MITTEHGKKALHALGFLVVVMAALAIHQMYVAPMIAKHHKS